MSALSSKLRSIGFGTAGTGIAFWCPGCDKAHRVRTDGPGGMFNQGKWEWDGNIEAPTINPSIKVQTTFIGASVICHSFVKAGQIQFLGDCTHKLAGQTVPLPDWPKEAA